MENNVSIGPQASLAISFEGHGLPSKAIPDRTRATRNSRRVSDPAREMVKGTATVILRPPETGTNARAEAQENDPSSPALAIPDLDYALEFIPPRTRVTPTTVERVCRSYGSFSTWLSVKSLHSWEVHRVQLALVEAEFEQAYEDTEEKGISLLEEAERAAQAMQNLSPEQYMRELANPQTSHQRQNTRKLQMLKARKQKRLERIEKTKQQAGSAHEHCFKVACAARKNPLDMFYQSQLLQLEETNKRRLMMRPAYQS